MSEASTAPMSRRVPARPRAWAVLVPTLAFVLLGVVGSAASSASGRTGTTGRAGASAASAATTRAKIKTDWITFFAGATPPKRKIALLQNGEKFAKVLESQGALSKSVGAKVLQVTVTSASRATVRYTITLAGQPALANQKGESVLQGGVWKVGAASFCGLLALEQTKTKACPSAS